MTSVTFAVEIDEETEIEYLRSVASRGGGYKDWAESQAGKLSLDLDFAYKVPVLMYHHLESGYYYGKSGSTLATEKFEEHMKWLYDNGWQSISVEQLYDHLTHKAYVSKKSFVITFDDGYESSYTEAYPILKKYGFTATQFLIGNKNLATASFYIPYLKDEQINEMKDVFTFANHTYNMHYWQNGSNGVLASETYDLIYNDLDKMENTLSDYDQLTTFKSMAYPYGRVMIDYNETTLQVLEDLDIEMAFTTEHGYAEFGDKLLEMDRFSIYRWTRLSQLTSYMNKAMQ